MLLQKIRDEAHRFAVSYHRVLKKKTDFSSVIEDIPGIGKKTVKSLIKHFGSLDEIRKASLEDIMDVPSINRKRAEKVYDFLHNADR